MSQDFFAGRNGLVIIDPQNDFCDPKGALYVPGAEEDMARLAKHLLEHGAQYSDLVVSLDSHDKIAIFHPKYWVNDEGNHPAPYTEISRKEFDAGVWRPASQRNKTYTKRWLDRIDREKKFSMMIWPEHCIVSTWGHQICDTIVHALDVWRDVTGRSVRYVFKGELPYADQFSIFDVADDSWHDEQACEDLTARLAICDTLTFAGEAISHCVQESVIAYMMLTSRGGGRANQRVRVLGDCTSPVAGFSRELSEKLMAKYGAATERSDR